MRVLTSAVVCWAVSASAAFAQAAVGTSVKTETRAAAAAPAAPATAPSAADKARKPIDLPRFASRVMDQWDAAIPLRVWPAGSTIETCFMGGTPAERAMVVASARTWMQHANIVFAFGPAPAFATCAPGAKTKLRILMNTDPTQASSYSQLGTDLLRVPADKHNMAVTLVTSDGKRRSDALIAKTALHELGHVLGLQHMHQHPDAKCFDLTDWTRACKTWPEFKQANEPVKLAAYTSTNLAPRQRMAGVAPSPYDPLSIMHYRFPVANFTTATAACTGEQTYVLSEGDKAVIAQLYPKNRDQQARMIVERGQKIGHHITGLRGLSQAEARALALYAEAIVKRVWPTLAFKVDITGFRPSGRLEFVGAQWTTAEKLQYGRGTEAPDKCGLTPAAAPARAAQVPAAQAPATTSAPAPAPAAAAPPPAVPTAAPPKPAPRRYIELQKR